MALILFPQFHQPPLLRHQLINLPRLPVQKLGDSGLFDNFGQREHRLGEVGLFDTFDRGSLFCPSE
jgi:hypothetical protein